MTESVKSATIHEPGPKRSRTMRALMSIIAAAALWTGGVATPASADDLLVKKQAFDLPSFTTEGGRTLRNIRVGWESYGTLNADKSNAILICHFFSANSHAAGKYEQGEKVPGYWDAIIGPGKAIDTDKWFVLSVDSLVNLNTGDPNTITTGPASADPDTGKPYGLNFPVVTIGDFVEVQKALVETLGIRKLHMVAGPSMGALQTYEWAASHPEMVDRIMPVIGFPAADANLIAWLDIWSAPVRLDPKWNHGDYYGKEPPLDGLALALKIITLHANHWEWADASFGRKWAKDGQDPAGSLDTPYLADAALSAAGYARARVSDANHLLYLAKANQLFVAGSRSGARTLEDAAARLKAPTLLITSPRDLVFHKDGVESFVAAMKQAGNPVQHLLLEGNRGHLDGVISIQQAQDQIRAFVNR
jgi:homoserine O-acetyltransferase/O-succinyltransferase